MFKKCLLVVCLSFVQITSSFANFYIGGTRVVYNESSKGTSIKVGNKASDRVYLIQSWVEDANSRENKQFIVTPPLFRLNESDENLLRIIFKGSNTLPKDRESLFWLNIKAVPGEPKGNENKLSLAFKNKIKLFYRPKAIEKGADEAYKQLQFKRSGNSLTVINPTPYFLTLNSIKGNNKELLKEPKMVEPQQQLTVSISGKFSTITWKTINDYGGSTPEQQTSV